MFKIISNALSIDEFKIPKQPVAVSQPSVFPSFEMRSFIFFGRPLVFLSAEQPFITSVPLTLSSSLIGRLQHGCRNFSGCASGFNKYGDTISPAYNVTISSPSGQFSDGEFKLTRLLGHQ